MTVRGYLGIDVGSISTNFVFLNEQKELLFSSYVRASGSPILSVQACMKQMVADLNGVPFVLGVCTTGSGRELAGAMVGADVVKNEISAHARAALELHPDVQTVIEIGGQDSKVTILRDGAVVDFAMNLVCAAGTGSFLDSQARRLNMSIEDFSEKSISSSSPTTIAGRCTVFAESDMIHKQQIGIAQEDILMGLCHALARNFLSNVCRGKEILPPVMLQGGVSANKGIRRAFEEALQSEIIVPQHHMVMGAYGAALLAMDAAFGASRFRGVEVSEQHIQTRAFDCADCPNTCEIIEIRDTESVIGTAGGRCGKWSV